MQRVAVIDYGMGNLHSVKSALEHVSEGAEEIVVTSDRGLIESADRIVFPGQGAAADCMRAIGDHELQNVVEHCAQEKPFLGICMGMQVLLQRSDENNGVDCLGTYAGRVAGFAEQAALQNAQPRLKIPHMGWNTIHQSKPHPLWNKVPEDSYFYFVHSYFVAPEDPGLVAGTTTYGLDFASVIASGTVFAMQCHPEKSAGAGLQLLRNFLHWDGSTG